MQRVTMDKLTSDSTKSEIITMVKDILRALSIDDSHSEHYHPHKNFTERRHKTIKRYKNSLIDKTGAPTFA